MDALITQYLSTLPDWLLAVISIIGMLRLVVKPVMTIIQKIVKETPSKKDDAWLEKLLKSKGYRIFRFILDLVASIKLPKKR